MIAIEVIKEYLFQELTTEYFENSNEFKDLLKSLKHLKNEEFFLSLIKIMRTSTNILLVSNIKNFLFTYINSGITGSTTESKLRQIYFLFTNNV